MPRFNNADDVRAYLNAGGDRDPIQQMQHLSAAAAPELHLSGNGSLIVTPARRSDGTTGYTVRHAGTGHDVTAGDPFATLEAAHAYAARLVEFPGFDWDSPGLGARICAYEGFWMSLIRARQEVGIHA